MSSSWIEIDDEVLGQIKGKAEPFVDSPNDVLRAVFGLEAKKRPTCAQLPSPAPREGRRPLPVGRRPEPFLPESEYQGPLLLALAQLGGSAHSSEATDLVGGMIWERLTDLDKEPLQSGEVRWRNRLGFARMAAIKQGFIRGDSRRGIWELTAAGRKRAEELEASTSSAGGGGLQ